MSSKDRLATCVLALACLAPPPWLLAANPPPETPAVSEHRLDSTADTKAEPSGPVPELQKRLERGEAQLGYDPKFGYLLSVLQALAVPQSSQLLVFSKTSCQRERISPRTPRAIYFNDRVYVAWIPGAPLLEISGADPGLGAVFYTIDQRDRARPRLTRRDQCLECHTSRQTLGVAGYIVRSYATDTNGVIDFTDGASMVDHRTPFTERWGGWYLCGATGPAHRGAAFDIWPKTAGLPPAQQSGNQLPDPGVYPQITSDPVALLVLQHQAQMQNLITRLRGAGEAGPDRALMDEFLRYLLFTDEAPWAGSIDATPAFHSWFQGQGPRDKQGRSLRDFDLQTRLFKLPCSYMIYSDSFAGLPRGTKLQVYRRLWRILRGEETDSSYARLSADSRRAVLEILQETKADLPLYWKL